MAQNRIILIILNLSAYLLVSLSIFLVTPILQTDVPAQTQSHEGAFIEWSAGWIAPPELEVQPNTWICYRRMVNLPTKPEQAITRIAVDSKYWLWVNGELAVYEGQLKRGPTPDDTYFDTVDLAPWLRQGENTIAVLVWYFGKHGFSHKNSGQPGLIFQMKADGTELLSDDSWRARKHPAFGDTDAPHPNYRLPESNIRYDARQALSGWTDPEYDDSSWPAAQELGSPPAEPWNHLWERPIPLWKTSELREYENADEFPLTSNGVGIVAELPYNAMVSPYLKIQAPAGLTIDIRTENYLVGSTPSLRHEYVTTDGVQEFEFPAWINGHEVHYAIPEGIRILALKYRKTGYNTDFVGEFLCEDPFFNKLWRRAQRTLYITMRETYMDCPDRERAQWWGDAVNELGEAFYALDTRSHDLAKKGILELVHWQRDDHTIYSPVPSGNYDRELPLQMLNSVGEYGFWTYYFHSGDAATIREAYPHVRDYLSVWELGDDGLVTEREGGWQWIDWGEHKDQSILYNAWYYLALQGAVKMARLVGSPEYIPAYQQQMETIRENFNSAFWTGGAYRSPDYQGETDDRANAMAVVSGLADPAYYDAIRKVLNEEYHASPYMEKYVLEALFLMGYPEDALQRIKRRYQPMMKMGITTLPEGWSIGFGSYNHGWSGGPLTMLSQYVAGVAPESPGYDRYHVLPQMGPLRIVNVVVPSVKGHIELRLRRDRDTFDVHLNSPDATEAVVGIPKKALPEVRSVSANGIEIWRNGQPMDTVDGITFQGENPDYLLFETEPGQWEFDAEQ